MFDERAVGREADTVELSESWGDMGGEAPRQGMAVAGMGRLMGSLWVVMTSQVALLMADVTRRLTGMGVRLTGGWWGLSVKIPA